MDPWGNKAGDLLRPEGWDSQATRLVGYEDKEGNLNKGPEVREGSWPILEDASGLLGLEG